MYFKPQMDSPPILATLNPFTFQNRPLRSTSLRRAATSCPEDGLILALLSGAPEERLTVSLSPPPDSSDVTWHNEAPPFQAMLNESEPTWGWEDEQGFSALRHSGRTVVSPVFPCPIPPTSTQCGYHLLHRLVISALAIAGGGGYSPIKVPCDHLLLLHQPEEPYGLSRQREDTQTL